MYVNSEKCQRTSLFYSTTWPFCPLPPHLLSLKDELILFLKLYIWLYIAKVTVSFGIYSALIMRFMKIMCFISVSCLFTFILVCATIWSHLSAHRDCPGKWMCASTSPGGSGSSWAVFITNITYSWSVYLPLNNIIFQSKHNQFRALTSLFPVLTLHTHTAAVKQFQLSLTQRIFSSFLGGCFDSEILERVRSVWQAAV